jgi:hypothetical protein
LLAGLVYYGPTKARMMFGDLPIIEAHAQAQLRVSSCAHLSLLFLSLAALSLSSPPPPVATHTSLARLCLPEALSSSGRLPHPLPRLYWYRTLLTRGEFFFSFPQSYCSYCFSAWYYFCLCNSRTHDSIRFFFFSTQDIKRLRLRRDGEGGSKGSV